MSVCSKPVQLSHAYKNYMHDRLPLEDETTFQVQPTNCDTIVWSAADNSSKATELCRNQVRKHCCKGKLINAQPDPVSSQLL